jgi:hypothetical protein
MSRVNNRNIRAATEAFATARLRISNSCAANVVFDQCQPSL